MNKIKLLDDFKAFAVKGNATDMAVGIIIGGAFGKIVSSLVSDIIMPPIGLLVGGVDFKDLQLVLKKAVTDSAGIITEPAVSINYGNFLQVVFDFLIISWCVFMLVKGLAMLRASATKKEAEQAAQQQQEQQNQLTKQETLLTEIRDILKEKH